MKTQISRDGFRPEQRYSGVYQQQGRMITDRDWNELVDILKARLDDGMADAVGSGVPRRRGAGLARSAQGGIAISPGVVYTGGLAASIVPAPGVASGGTFAYDQQADFPFPPALPSNRDYVLYADLWERPVLALEDDELRDPGLNGADTTTRTRTMAQLKWAHAPWNPQDPVQNPTRGNATLDVSVPAGGPGDPFGAPGALSQVGGDYLLRVEVHDVKWGAGDAVNNPSHLVLKWSRENGAEQHKALEAPSSFRSGPWVYELFKLRHEMVPGYHWPRDWQPSRGELSSAFRALDPTTDTDSFIRRWDSYCVLSRSGPRWNLGSSSSSTSDTAAEPVQKSAPGAAVTLDDGRLIVKLVDLELRLDVQGKVLLPGDYWQVPVRRVVHPPGTQILEAATPHGIGHRYLTLATVNAAGDVTPAAPSFPALSELAAGDVRYDGSGCLSGLFDGSHDTVKKALDRLWQLDAVHAAYTKPADTSLYKGKTVANVREALNLLSDVRARQVLVDGRPAVPDVQAAVDELFGRPSGDANGYTVGTGGELGDLETALRTLLGQQKRDIRLLLLPGNHALATVVPFIAIAPETSLTIAGVGETSRLTLNAFTSFSGFGTVTLRDLALEVSDPARLSVGGGEVNLLRTRISGTSKLGQLYPAAGARLLLRDNVVFTVAGLDDSPGVFMKLASSGAAVRLENNEIYGTVVLYSADGDILSTGLDLSPADLAGLGARLSSIGFDPSAGFDLVATGNWMTGFRVGSGMIGTIRWAINPTSPDPRIRADAHPTIQPLFRRILLTDNTFVAGQNQLIADCVELNSNLLSGASFGWVIGEETLFVGNAARTDVSLDSVTRNLVQAGNSAHLKLRQISGGVQI